ncbi:MAG TPA: type IV toxin-antitoxin system AbiEi family antitoxin [Lutibacter sp.]
MSTYIESKINQLLQDIPQGVVVLASWLHAKGYSYELQRRYKESQWLESIGNGALKRKGDTIDVYGALYAMQQAAKNVHIGGPTSLQLQGFSHYIKMGDKKVYLFSEKKFNIPKWFKQYVWREIPIMMKRNLLPPNLGLVDFQHQKFSIKISSPARAILECLEMSPAQFDLVEASQIMEGLNTLKPNDVQLLLEQCTSIKVKRLFLFLAEKSGHSWFNYLKLERINLGAGKRKIVENGVYNAKYQITVPKSLML